MELELPYLQSLALRLFSICPNSASCERGFSMCGWICNKRRLRLGVERLESIAKIISYYRSNAHSEFGFYGKGTKKESVKLSDSEINAIVNNNLAELEPKKKMMMKRSSRKYKFEEQLTDILFQITKL